MIVKDYNNKKIKVKIIKKRNIENKCEDLISSILLVLFLGIKLKNCAFYNSTHYKHTITIRLVKNPCNFVSYPVLAMDKLISKSNIIKSK
jgi:hypothetical protein